MPFISSSELCSRIKALYRKTWYLNNPFQNIYTYCGVCVKSSDMHSDEVKDTAKELRYVKMDIVPENNTF